MKMILFFDRTNGYEYDEQKSIENTIKQNIEKIHQKQGFLKRTQTLLNKTKDKKEIEKLKKRYKEHEEQYKYLQQSCDKGIIKSQYDYFKPFIEQRIKEIKLKIKKQKEDKINDKFDKCFVWYNNEIEQQLNYYFKLGYTLSVKPYSIGKGKILICLTKKYDINYKIDINDIILDLEDILRYFRDYKIDDFTFEITDGYHIYY